MRKLLIILNIPVDDLNMDEALKRIEEFIAIGRKTGKVHQIATVNADFAVKALNDPELRYLLHEADMSTADGMPLVWGARLLGVPMEGRVTGSDMVPALAELAARKGYSIYFYGAAEGVAQKTADILKERHPDLIVAGVCSPPFKPVIETDESLLDDIRAAKPDVLLVALGNPKQEKWIGMFGKRIGVPVMIGIGASLDFIAGESQRAPVWMQKAGLEWIHRFAQEPSRLWKRYVVDLFAFGTFFVRQWWLMRRGNVSSPLLPTDDSVIVEETAVLNIKGRLTIQNRTSFVEKAEEALAETPFVIINMSEATFLDSTALGALVGLAKQAHDLDGKLWLTAVPKAVYQSLTLMRLDRFFEVVDNVEAALAMRHEREQKMTIISVPKPKEAEVEGLQWQVMKMPRRLDASTVPEITESCMKQLESDSYLIADCSELVFLTSAGLAMLAQLDRKVKEQDGVLRVAGCARDTLRVIEMTRFDRVLSLFDSVAEAQDAELSAATQGKV